MAVARRANTKTWQFVVVLALLALCVVPFYRLAYNILFIGYNWFGEMRLAIVFFAVMIRLLLYPVRMLAHYTRRLERKADAEYQQVSAMEDSPSRKDAEKNWLSRNRFILMFILVQLIIYLIVTFSSGRIFYSEFTQERTQDLLYSFVAEPEFPLNTTSWLPFVGLVDLSKVNHTLNIYATVGAGLVGLFEVIIHRKTRRRELFMLLVMYPVAAYLITVSVPAGFKLSLLSFSALTILAIFVEKGVVSLFRKLLGGGEKPVTV